MHDGVIGEFGRAARAAFLIEGDVAYLNHGGYGATPQVVLAAADAWRLRMERQPVRFMKSELPSALRAAAARLGHFLGANGEDLVFVDNATTAINAIVRSLDIGPGDILATTDHGYAAVRRTLDYVASRTGARVAEIALPFPAVGADATLDALTRGWPGKVKLFVVDHLASPTALVLPVERMAAFARAKGARVLIDGAHAPGQLALDLPRLGGDWYVGNCHKWLFAPKGCGFLWARREARAGLHPAVISHGYGEGFHAEFDWTGTRDHSPWLAVTAALDFVEALDVDRMRAWQRELRRRAGDLLQQAWGVPAGGPDDMLAAMTTLRLPDRHQPAGPADKRAAERVHDLLWANHRVEAPIVPFAGRLWLRISAQIYNHLDEYRALAAALG
ncbi:MAG TPA: aminotransferase class V-fold PLP-dependent enzyme [Alphaproteobacteria bacterium]|nr:aminotransferase class V-fold PLP-dependent enzyme [Alphaproteobacteria bacterium]